MPNTTNYGLTTPSGSSSDNVPADMAVLSGQLETILSKGKTIVQAFTATGTISATAGRVVTFNGAASQTLTVPAGTSGQSYEIWNIDPSDSVTITPSGADTINGGTLLVIPAGFTAQMNYIATYTWAMRLTSSSGKPPSGILTLAEISAALWQAMVMIPSARVHGEIIATQAATAFVGDGSLNGATLTTTGSTLSASGQAVLVKTAASVNATAVVHSGFVGSQMAFHGSFAAKIALNGVAGKEAWAGLLPSSPLGTTCPSGGAGFRISGTGNIFFVYNTGAGEVAVDTSATSVGATVMLDFWWDSAPILTWRVRTLGSVNSGAVSQENTGQIAGLTPPATTVGPFVGVRSIDGSFQSVGVHAFGYQAYGSMGV